MILSTFSILSKIYTKIKKRAPPVSLFLYDYVTPSRRISAAYPLHAQEFLPLNLLEEIIDRLDDLRGLHRLQQIALRL